eukprot:4057292-Pyramimonas_sp.AAC.1
MGHTRPHVETKPIALSPSGHLGANLHMISCVWMGHIKVASLASNSSAISAMPNLDKRSKSTSIKPSTQTPTRACKRRSAASMTVSVIGTNGLPTASCMMRLKRS